MSQNANPYTQPYVNPYTQSSQAVKSTLPVPLTCDTSYTATLALTQTSEAAPTPVPTSVITIDKAVFNDPAYFNALGSTAYTTAITAMDGSNLLLSNDNIESRLALKAQGMINACCGQVITKVSFDYTAIAFLADANPTGFTEVISTQPTTIFNRASATFDTVIQKALIGFFTSPLLFKDANSYVIGFSASYVFTPLVLKGR